MPSPFPGMDPYLEKAGLWPDVHHTLISRYRELLAAQLRPKYLVRIDERAYITEESDDALKSQSRVPDVEIAGRPGWEETPFSLRGEESNVEVADPVIATTWFEEQIHEAYLKIIDVESRNVVTFIELLSPTNKVAASPGQASFEQTRREVMYSPSHWVEIDLLRGKRLVRVPKKVGSYEYLVHVSRQDQRPRGLLYPIRLSQRLPVIPIPLKGGDPDARLDLQVALDAIYDRAGYDLEIDYRNDPNPPLIGKQAEWADELLRSKGLRS
jgi:Protein of unknown function (DUF4058)